MALRTFKILVFSLPLFAYKLAIADELSVDSCYENSGSYQVIECINQRIETAKINLNNQRKLFVNKNQDILHDDKRFDKKEASINKKWLLFANDDCKMRSFHSGDEDSIMYQTVFGECMFNMYLERTNSLKNSLKLIEG